MNWLNLMKSTNTKDNREKYFEDFLFGKDETLDPKFTKVLGTNYNVNIYYLKINTPELFINDSSIVINLPMNLRKNDNQELINKILLKMYTKITKNILEDIMEKARHEFGFAPEDYYIKEMQSTLAYFNNDAQIMIINPFISKYSKDVIEYVIFHEFCHIKYKNHTKKFYDLLRKYKPNFQTLANQLSNYKY